MSFNGYDINQQINEIKAIAQVKKARTDGNRRDHFWGSRSLAEHR